MKKILICVAFISLFGSFAKAQVKSVTGVVVKEILENKWAAIVIDVGGKKYFVQTEFHASYGDERDGVKSWNVKTIGNINEGRTVQVFYKKIGCTHTYEEGVPCWLEATKIVEIKKGSLIEPRGSSAKRVNLPSYIHPQQRAVLQEWLSKKAGWRPATLGGNYRTYYIVADFNRDGSKDFAIILVNKSSGSARYAVVIFNGPFGNNRDISPAFYTEDVSEGDRLFWMTGDKFGNRFIVGPPESDAGYIVRPRGRGYVVE